MFEKFIDLSSGSLEWIIWINWVQIITIPKSVSFLVRLVASKKRFKPLKENDDLLMNQTMINHDNIYRVNKSHYFIVNDLLL